MSNAEALRVIAISAAYEAAPALVEAFRGPIDVSTKKNTHDLVTYFDTATERRLIDSLRAATPRAHFTAEESGHSPSPQPHHDDASFSEESLEWIIDPIDGTSNFAHGFPAFSISVAAVYEDAVQAAVVYDPIHDQLFSANATTAFIRESGKETPLRPRRSTAPETARSDSVEGSEETRSIESPSGPVGLRQAAELNLITGFPSAEALSLNRTRCLEVYAELVEQFSTVRRMVSGALELCYTAAGWADVVFGVRTQPWDVAAGQAILQRAGGQYLPFGHRPSSTGVMDAGCSTMPDASPQAGVRSGDGDLSSGGARSSVDRSEPVHYDGTPRHDGFRAPHYLAMAPGVESPEALRLMRTLLRTADV